MKLIFISDIHGIKTNLDKLKPIIDTCDKLVVLGDLYYIGPRNKINNDYDILFVQEFLTNYKDKLICMRGNCDSNVDISVSDFTINEGINYLNLEGIDTFISHGDYYNSSYKKINDNSVLIYGHEHIPYIKNIDNKHYICVGSIAIPRDNKPTYLIYEDRSFILYDIEGKVINSLKI